MISVTAQQLAALKDRPRVKYLLEFTVGTTTYRFTNTDTSEIYNSQTYMPGFIDEMPDIEITSDLKIGSLSILLSDPEKIITTAFLSQLWMNKKLAITKLYQDENGDLIKAKNAIQGLLSDISIDIESSTVEPTSSGPLADFEQISAIRTNAKSQQRYYPTDTAFEHSQRAIDKVYWGKDAPTLGNSGVSGGVPTFGDPDVEAF